MAVLARIGRYLMIERDEIKPALVVEPCGWTPARGLLSAGCWLLVATAVAIGLSWPVAAYVPHVLFHWAIRAALAFLIGWMMFGIAQSKASFVGPSVTAMALAAAVLVLLSHHLVVSIVGYATTDGRLSGPDWYHPMVLLILNLPAMGALLFCAFLRHDGGGDTNTLLDIFMRRY